MRNDTWRYWIRFVGSAYASILMSVDGNDEFASEESADNAAKELYPHAAYELWQASSHQGHTIQPARQPNGRLVK